MLLRLPVFISLRHPPSATTDLALRFTLQLCSFTLFLLVLLRCIFASFVLLLILIVPVPRLKIKRILLSSPSLYLPPSCSTSSDRIRPPPPRPRRRRGCEIAVVLVVRLSLLLPVARKGERERVVCSRVGEGGGCRAGEVERVGGGKSG